MNSKFKKTYATVLGSVFFLTSCNLGKPDVCDCNEVYQKEYPDIKVVERIMNNDAKYITGNPIERARMRCRVEWGDDLKEFGGYSASAAESFFREKCKKD